MERRRRSVHWVGSLPLGSAGAAMRWQVEAAGPCARYIVDGETGARATWIANILSDELARDPALMRLRRGGFGWYADMPLYAKRPGARFRPRLPYAGYARESWEAFEALGLRSRGYKLQFGLPDPWQIPAMSGLWRHRAAFADALADTVHTIGAMSGGEVVVQVELPVQTALVAACPLFARGGVVARVARGFGRFVELLPREVPLALHLCYSDLNNRSLVSPRDSRAVVELANELAWRVEHLEYVHVPFAFGRRPPPVDRGFYGALRHLVLPPGAALAAGFAHERARFGDQADALAEIERLTERRVMVSAACGEGRRSLGRADLLARRKRELAEYPT